MTPTMTAPGNSMNALIDDLDLGQADPDQDEKNNALHGAIPEGKYHARLVEASEEMAGTYEVDRLRFEVLHGPYKGKLVPTDLFHTGSDDAKTAKAKLKRRTFYHRLGLLTKAVVNGEKRYSLTPGRTSVRDCLGEQVIIDVVVKDEEFQGKKGLVKIKKNDLSYMGIFKLDDPEVKDVPRANGVAPPLPAASKPVNLDGI